MLSRNKNRILRRQAFLVLYGFITSTNNTQKDQSNVIMDRILLINITPNNKLSENAMRRYRYLKGKPSAVLVGMLPTDTNIIVLLCVQKKKFSGDSKPGCTGNKAFV
jgi:hypothetical protein